MNPRILLSVCVAAALLASGCDGDGDGDRADVEFPALPPGAHAVRIEGDVEGVSGLAFVARDGHAFVALAPESDAASTVLYRRKARSGWLRTPTSGDGAQTPRLALAEQLPDAALVALGGRYEALVEGQHAAFSISENGKIRALAGPCFIDGQLEPRSYGEGARVLSLRLRGCAQANGTYQGAALHDPDAKNARFRAILSSADKIVDFFAYAI